MGKVIMCHYGDDLIASDFKCRFIHRHHRYYGGILRQIRRQFYSRPQRKGLRKEAKVGFFVVRGTREPIRPEVVYSSKKWEDYFSEFDLLDAVRHLCVIKIVKHAASEPIPQCQVPQDDFIYPVYKDPRAKPFDNDPSGEKRINPAYESRDPTRVGGKPLADGTSLMHVLHRMRVYYSPQERSPLSNWYTPIFRDITLYSIHYHVRPRPGTAYLHATPSRMIFVVSPQEKWELLHKNEAVLKEPEELEVDQTSVPVYTGGLPRNEKVYKVSHDDSEDATPFLEMKLFQRHMDSTFTSGVNWREAAKLD
jgi:hypothetical protein